VSTAVLAARRVACPAGVSGAVIRCPRPGRKVSIRRRTQQWPGDRGRQHHVVIDCPDPLALARLYSELLGLTVTYQSQDWVVIADNDQTSGLAERLVLEVDAARGTPTGT